jgi:hypothetical protein
MRTIGRSTYNPQETQRLTAHEVNQPLTAVINKAGSCERYHAVQSTKIFLEEPFSHESSRDDRSMG